MGSEMEQRKPHPATVVQRREPHPATVVQAKHLPPHPATVVQAKTPHPATAAPAPAPAPTIAAQMMHGLARRGTTSTPSTQAAQIVVDDECHILGMEIRLVGVGKFDGAPSDRYGTANGGNPFYQLKKRQFLFRQIRPGRYRVSARWAYEPSDAISQLVDVKQGSVVQLVARLSHHPPNGLTLERIRAARSLVSANIAQKSAPTPIRRVERHAPTRIYLMSHERTARPKKGRHRKLTGPILVWQHHPYFKQYTIPLEMLLHRESQYLKSHVVLYTAMRFDLLLLHVLWAELVKQGVVGGEIFDSVRWFRSPLATNPTTKNYEDVRDFLSAFGNKINDNNATFSWTLQSCNMHVFGNTLTSSEESTADFYWDGMAVNEQQLGTHINDTLDAAKLLMGRDCKICKQKRQKLSQTLISLIEGIRPTAHPKGVLFQIFIPHGIVNEVAYITRTVTYEDGGKRTNGQPDEDHPDCLATLLQMQTSSGPSLVNYERLQARLYLPRVLLPGSGIVVHEYTQVKDTTMATFRESVAKVVKELLAFVAQERKELIASVD